VIEWPMTASRYADSKVIMQFSLQQNNSMILYTKQYQYRMDMISSLVLSSCLNSKWHRTPIVEHHFN